MSTAIGVSADGVRLPIARSRVAEIARGVLRAEKVSSAMLSVSFVSNREIRRLNREHLGRDRLTDVIAFSFRASGKRAPVVGDVYIAPQVARESARTNGITVKEELTRLIVHGTLHVLGHDHPETATRSRSKMWRRQEALVASFSRPAR